MRYADYYDCDICNGNHVGMSLFVSGCPFHCEGCFNSELWDFNTGVNWNPFIENKFLELVGRSYIRRVTFVGGSPLCDQNVGDIRRIIQKIRTQYPDKEIWVYTGYTWEEIMSECTSDHPILKATHKARRQVLDNIDVLIDGRFELNKKDITLPFRGSTNQRIIDVKKSLQVGGVVLWEHNDG